jgi:hypothetical protein
MFICSANKSIRPFARGKVPLNILSLMMLYNFSRLTFPPVVRTKHGSPLAAHDRASVPGQRDRVDDASLATIA